jgi:hypothetical protein
VVTELATIKAMLNQPLGLFKQNILVIRVIIFRSCYLEEQLDPQVADLLAQTPETYTPN